MLSWDVTINLPRVFVHLISILSVKPFWNNLEFRLVVTLLSGTFMCMTFGCIDGNPRGLWEPGTLEAWDIGSLGHWKHGTLGAWDIRSIGHWEHETLGAWDIGSIGLWESGTLGA